LKHRTKFWANPLITIIFALILATGCEKDKNNNNNITVNDKDGNVYHTITIGTQVWMDENLKTTRFNDGTYIPLVTDTTIWSNLDTIGYCWFENDSLTYKNPYGALYNWYTINTGKLCPSGWHVPTDTEWTTLTTYLGGESEAGGKLKELGLIHWSYPNSGADNSSGFTALPGGSRLGNGTFNAFGIDGYWWSSTEYNGSYAWYRCMTNQLSSVSRYSFYKQYGFSVRCVKD
jgi:uncharacterized protein (TIGR02145 family)